MKNISLHLIIVFSIFLYSCSSFNYVSNDVQTPCFTEAKTLRVNLHLSLQNFEPVVAYSINSFLGVSGSFSVAPYSSPNSFYEGINGHVTINSPSLKGLNNFFESQKKYFENRSGEIGLLFYRRINNKIKPLSMYNTYFDLNSGIGFGVFNNENKTIFLLRGNNELSESKYFKGYIQSNLYFKKQCSNDETIYFGIGTKLNLLKYDYLKRTNNKSVEGHFESANVTVQRSAYNFIMPIQDIYLFLSSDSPFYKKLLLNFSFKAGYTIPFESVKYSSRKVLYIDPDYPSLAREFQEMNDELNFGFHAKKNDYLNFFINLSLGIKL